MIDPPNLGPATLWSLFEALPLPLALLDAQAPYRVIAANARYLEAAGASREAVIGQPLPEAPWGQGGSTQDIRGSRVTTPLPEPDGSVRFLLLHPEMADLRASVERDGARPPAVPETVASSNDELRQAYAMVRNSYERERELSYRLEQERDRLKEAQAVAHIGSWELDLVSNTLHWSDEAYRIFGVDRARLGASYEAFLERVHPDDRATVDEAYHTSVRERMPYSIEHRMVGPDGRVRHVHERCQTFYDANGTPLRSVGTTQDITERKQADLAMRQAATVFGATNEGIIVADRDARITSVNPAFTRITGFTAEEIIGQKPSLWQSGQHDQRFYERMWSDLNATGQWEGELWNRRKGGEIYPVWQNISAVRDESGKILHYVSIFTDISATKAAEARMAHLAHHDLLTGLPNRVLFGNSLDAALERARRYEKRTGVLLLDLDRFKLINDTLGHAAGDALLQEIADRLRACARADDTVARLGGDEFAVIVHELGSPHDATLVAHKMIEAISKPCTLAGKSVITTASVGIALFPDDGQSASQLVQAADAAMYRAKAQGRNTCAFYSPDLSVEAEAHLQLETELRNALANREFTLHYQPQAEMTTGRIVGVEALLRWQHPQRGLLSPDDFIRVAEESGLIEPIGEWVLHTALAQMQQWSRDGLPGLRMAINVSGRQILYDHLADVVIKALSDAGASSMAPMLELEITESVLLSFERCARVLERLRQYGVRIAIDDFGTGYSSLSALKNLPVDTLKIDRSFVRGLPDAADSRAIATAVIAMARGLRLRVVAEGAETSAQLDLLRVLGCDEVQGFAIAKPMPPEEIVRLFAAPIPA